MCELNIQRTVEGDSFYHCLLDTGSEASYSSNVHLAGQSLGNIGDKIVVLYEGEAGKQDYIHDGRAVVAFVDGHTKMVTEDDAKQLRWMP
jgi:prepilin-type processing-associated H-X9-DG protein